MGAFSAAFSGYAEGGSSSPYNAVANISFGASATGIADVRVQPMTAAGVDTGSALSATISEIGLGMYTFSGTVPADAVHWRAYSAASPSTYIDSGVFVTGLTAQQVRNAMALPLTDGTTVEDESLDDKVLSLATSDQLDELQAAVLGAVESIDVGESSLSDEAVAALVANLTAALAGNAINLQSLFINRGVMEVIAGDAYSDARMQPFTRENWTGTNLDGKSGVMRFLRLDLYETKADHTQAVLTVAGGFTQSGTTVTLHFPMTAADTALLAPTSGTKGITKYAVQVIANDPILESPWLGRADVYRKITSA